MRKICIILSLLACFIGCSAQEKVCLKQGTMVSIKILSELNSRSHTTPVAVINGDVYDESGEYILIHNGENVDIQTNATRATLFGDEGSLDLTPISTTAFNGRLITFVAEPVHFVGAESLLTSRKQAKIKAGTSFTATIANDYWFKME